MNDKVQVARIKFKQEGDYWVAYLAHNDSMDNARIVSSIPMEVAQYEEVKDALVELVKLCVVRIIKNGGSDGCGEFPFKAEH